MLYRFPHVLPADKQRWPAAEAAIGLAILVVLFRERSTIDVEDLDSLQG